MAQLFKLDTNTASYAEGTIITPRAAVHGNGPDNITWTREMHNKLFAGLHAGLKQDMLATVGNYAIDKERDVTEYEIVREIQRIIMVWVGRKASIEAIMDIMSVNEYTIN